MREKPYAASEHSTSTPAVTTTVTSVLLRNQRRIPLSPSAEPYAEPVTVLANHRGGMLVVSASGLSDVDSAHSSGSSHAAATSSPATVSATLPARGRRRCAGAAAASPGSARSATAVTTRPGG